MPQKISSIQRPPKGVSPQASKFLERVVIMHPKMTAEKMIVPAIAVIFLRESFYAIPIT
jgi:hypothetical protein